MVPGSTLMYGSILRCVTRSPRLSISAPIEAEASPLPSEETTPPVTKMNLVLTLAMRCLSPGPVVVLAAQIFLGLLQIRRRVDFDRGLVHVGDADAIAVRQRAELLELFRLLERARPHARELQEKIPPVSVDPDVAVAPELALDRPRAVVAQ